MAEKEVTDRLGRKIRYRELDPADMLNLMEAAGSNSGNTGWLQMALTVASVVMIDDVPFSAPTTKAQILHMARKIGNSGLVALNKEFFGDGTQADNADAEELETAKN